MPTKGDREEAVCPFCSILRRSALVRGQVFARPLPWIIVENPTDYRGKSLALSPRGRTLLRKRLPTAHRAQSSACNFNDLERS
jgi:hypothetical protein